LESKKGFSQGHVFLPIAEAVFQFDSAGLEDADIRQFTTFGIDLQKHLIKLLVDGGNGSDEVVVSRGFAFGLLAARTSP